MFQVSEAVRRYEDMIDYIHFSDQYCPNRNNESVSQLFDDVIGSKNVCNKFFKNQFTQCFFNFLL